MMTLDVMDKTKVQGSPETVSKPHRAPRHAWRFMLQCIGTFLTLALVVTWFFYFRPPVLGGPGSFVGVNGISMTPTFHDGDLVVVEKQSSYHVGDIIAYHVPAGDPGAGNNIIHRIVGGSGTTGFVTKGDHNPYTDHFWHPTTANVMGKVRFVIPQGAAWLSKLHNPLTLAVVVGLVSFIIIAWPSKKKPQRSPEHDSGGSAAPQDTTPDVSPTWTSTSKDNRRVGLSPRTQAVPTSFRGGQ